MHRALISAALASCALLGQAGFAQTTTAAPVVVPPQAEQVVNLDGLAEGKRFDGIGVVNGGGATAVLLKDYPDPQRSQILDLVYRPKFGASVSALLVEIPGDGNSTQGSMPSHMHTRNDLNYGRGYEWWLLREAKKRNPDLTLDGTAWSAPGWVGNGQFWSQDMVDYYVKFLQGLRSVYGLELDAIGARNEKGVSFDFTERLHDALATRGFAKVKLHGFDNWPANKFDFLEEMAADEKKRNSLDILSAHTLLTLPPETVVKVQQAAAAMGKPIWNTEEHVYKSGFDAEISIVQAFNLNYIRSGATKIVNWYDIAGVYPLEPYSETPSMLLARSPWSGNYEVREALWGYAHYGQFTQAGWSYIDHGSGDLRGGGSFVTLKSPGNDFSIILETKDSTLDQTVRFHVGSGLSTATLCVWRSDAREQFVRLPDVAPANGSFTMDLRPNSVYSLSTTRGQQKGTFEAIPPAQPFPFPYRENFEEYRKPEEWGYLPRYTADIAGVFEIANRTDGKGKALRQVLPVPANAWAPEWKPYTIYGDAAWSDYATGADVYLVSGESAGVMGRITEVGTGYGSVPKGYFFQVDSSGQCSLAVVRGKARKKAPIGDAEQQALLRSRPGESEEGEKVLSLGRVRGYRPGTWHRLALAFRGPYITGSVDGKAVLRAHDTRYAAGMAGLLAGSGEHTISRPYFDNLAVVPIRSGKDKRTLLLKDPLAIETSLALYSPHTDAPRAVHAKRSPRR